MCIAYINLSKVCDFLLTFTSIKESRFTEQNKQLSKTLFPHNYCTFKILTETSIIISMFALPSRYYRCVSVLP